MTYKFSFWFDFVSWEKFELCMFGVIVLEMDLKDEMHSSKNIWLNIILNIRKEVETVIYWPYTFYLCFIMHAFMVENSVTDKNFVFHTTWIT